LFQFSYKLLQFTESDGLVCLQNALVIPMTDHHCRDVKQGVGALIRAHLRGHPVSEHMLDYFLSNFVHGHLVTFKYLLIARRTISAKETFSHLAAALIAFICFRSISAKL
jgi:hypothetical protein